MNENIREISSVVNIDGKQYKRYTVKTPRIDNGDDIIEIFIRIVKDFLKDDDIIMAAESPISISQGRAYEFSKIKYGVWAKIFSRFVTRTPAGIGLGTPETMQLAINEVGFLRIFLAASVSAISRPWKRGLFYQIAGWKARGIDGPTSGTLPPYNGFATLVPKDPEGFAKEAERKIFDMTTKKVKFLVIDANDIGVNILSDRQYTEGVSILAKNILAQDNPMGQGHQSTPFIISRIDSFS